MPRGSSSGRSYRALTRAMRRSVVAMRPASERAFVERAQYGDQATHIRSTGNRDGQARPTRRVERCLDCDVNGRRATSRIATQVVEGGEELLVQIEVVVVSAPRHAARLARRRAEDRLLLADGPAIDGDDRARAVVAVPALGVRAASR